MTHSRKVTSNPDFVPKDAYVCPEFARLEKERLWPRVWLVACREEEVKQPGDFVTFNIADESISVVRNKQGDLRAYHNVCPHRGRRLTQGCGNQDGFFCKYHGWQWSLDGDNTVMIDGDDWSGVTADELALKPVRLDTWGGFVFVNIDGRAEPLSDYLKPFAEYWNPYRLQDMRYRWVRSVRLNCNWKVAMEAFIEGYHAQTTHNQYNPLSGTNRYLCNTFGRHSMFYDAGDLLVGMPGPNISLLPSTDAERFENEPDPRKRFYGFFELLNADLNGYVTEAMLRAVKRVEQEAAPDATPHDMLAMIYPNHVEELAKDGVDVSDIRPEHLQALGVDWSMFPNVIMLPMLDGLLYYRGRPCGDDPDWCVFEVHMLQRYAPGKEPPLDWKHADKWQDGDWPRIVVQDFINVEEVQTGMKSSAFPGAYPNPKAEGSPS